MLASFEEETSAACSSWRRLSWVEAKRGIGIGVGGGIMGGGGFRRRLYGGRRSDFWRERCSRELTLLELVLDDFHELLSGDKEASVALCPSSG